MLFYTPLVSISRGQSPAEAEFNFLDHAKRIDMYGMELHKARVNLSNSNLTISLLTIFTGQY